jgi:hypothetical protein
MYQHCLMKLKILKMEGNKKDEEINSEWEAKAAVFHIFNNVAKPGYK